MNPKFLLVAGLATTLTAGVALAQTPPPAPSAQAQAGPPAGPGPRGDFGPRFHRGGPGGPGARFMRGPRPTLEQIQQRNADVFARMDANRDGRVTFDEFRQEQERRRLERQRAMFQRFSGGADSVTLAQLNARTAERFNQRGPGRGAPPPERPAR